MKDNMIFVTGPFGAPVMEKAKALSAEKDLPFLSLDDEIERMDGRSVLRICMVMGEHEYRNKEYEALLRITGEQGSSGAVIACGDGVLLDDMSREIITSYSLVIEGADLTCKELFEGALCIKNPCHAFMHDSNKEKVREAFADLCQRQKAFFNEFI